MSYARPSLTEMIEQLVRDIESRLPGADARLGRSVLDVLARVDAGALYSLYGYIDFISRQVIPDSAEAEFLGRWCGVWGIARKSAAAATGLVGFTGAVGAVIPAGTVLGRSDGAQFALAADCTLTTGVGSGAVTASLAGLSSNTAAGATLTLVNPVAGVTSAATVGADGLTGGSDIEADDALRGRLLQRIQQPPMGGSKSDYVTWALKVPGVTRVWVYPGWQGLGTVGLTFVKDGQSPIIPGSTDVTAVQAALDLARPVTAQLTVFAPAAVPLNLSIHLSPDSTALRAAVQAQLVALIGREAVPGGTLYLSHIRQVVANAVGNGDSVISAPVADVTVTTGQITTLGTITWV